MSITASIKSAYRRIDAISAREFRVAVFICIVIAALNALFLAYRFGYMDGNDAIGCFRGIHRDYSYDYMRVKIEGALLVIGIALYFRRVVGFCISLLATAFVAIEYALWYLETQRWLKEMRVSAKRAGVQGSRRKSMMRKFVKVLPHRWLCSYCMTRAETTRTMCSC